MKNSRRKASTGCEILIKALKRFDYDVVTRVDGEPPRYRNINMRIIAENGQEWQLYNTVEKAPDGATGNNLRLLEMARCHEAEFMCLLSGIRRVRHETGDYRLIEFLYQMKIDDVISVFKANDEWHRMEHRHWIDQIKLWLRKEPSKMRRWCSI